MERKQYIDEIVKMEWEFFDKVQNKGGRASCQNNWPVFAIMRKSQYQTWEIELLKLYYGDLLRAKETGRNLITEKYGYMMEYTVPEEFMEIKDSLPYVSAEKKAIIQQIANIQVAWMEDFAREYPALAGNARTIHTIEDTPENTSYETYLKGELSTYSDDTLLEYGRFVISLYNKGENLAEKIMKETVIFYGYTSLEEAEQKQTEK